MKKITDGIILKAGTALSKTALSLAVASSNVTCWFFAYQPVQPMQLEKFKK
jgi:cyclic lactone autoinducer peptide